MPGQRIRQQRIKAGLCASCGELRGPDGTATECRKCANERNRKSALRMAAIRRKRDRHGLCIECGGPRDRRRTRGQTRRKDTLCNICRILKAQRDERYLEAAREPHIPGTRRRF